MSLTPKALREGVKSGFQNRVPKKVRQKPETDPHMCQFGTPNRPRTRPKTVPKRGSKCGSILERVEDRLGRSWKTAQGVPQDPPWTVPEPTEDLPGVSLGAPEARETCILWAKTAWECIRAVVKEEGPAREEAFCIVFYRVPWVSKRWGERSRTIPGRAEGPGDLYFMGQNGMGGFWCTCARRRP